MPAHSVDKRITDEQRAVVEANQGLVYAFVNRVYGREHPKYDDLIQEGVLGLMRAAQKYEPERGIEFSTYANYWIWQAISRYLDKDSLIRIPCHAGADARRGRGKFREQIEAARRVTRFDPTSDAFHPPVADDPARLVEAAEESETELAGLRRALARLSEYQLEVIHRRMAGETFRAIGESRGVCRERVRQVEKAALDRLRYNMGVTL